MNPIRVIVHLKPEVPDAPGTALFQALRQAGFEEVESVRLGRSIELELGEILTGESVRERVELMCQRVLVHPSIESYDIVEG